MADGIVKGYDDKKHTYIIETIFNNKKYNFEYRTDIAYITKAGKEMSGCWIKEEPDIDDAVEYNFGIVEIDGDKVKFLKFLSIKE